MAKKKDAHDTPAMRQYKGFKARHPDCVLFFRMGDFYEMFYEDAKLAHKVLGVALTQRTAGIPMAGVPFHSVESYLHRMIRAGHRVAVCDQVEDAALAKGVVKRDVTRVVTPGTLTDEGLLEEAATNPLAAVMFSDDDHATLAWAELSTGTFSLGSFAANELITYEALGLCPEGKAGEFIDSGAQTYGGQVVVNPSGGLISKGHPLGATGLAQCAELNWQVRGEAEKRQVDGAKLGLQHNLGLGGAAVVSLYKKGEF